MSDITSNPNGDGLAFTSSTIQDVWSGGKHGRGCEWWYFDALSDDSDEAVMITFIDNLIYSPRFDPNSHSAEQESRLVPAVAFLYYRNGKPLYRSIAEFSSDEFESSTRNPSCRIGKCSFEYTSAPYGIGYLVKIELPLSRGRKIRGTFEWLSIESDLHPDVEEPKPDPNHFWNLVAPRSDVTGKITIIDRRGRQKNRQFRGTGYHDHSSDPRWMPDSVENWFWGRAHFPFSTIVFYHYKERATESVISKMFLIEEGKMSEIESKFEFSKLTFNKFGLKRPEKLEITGDDLLLNLERSSTIDGSFFHDRTFSEMSLVHGGNRYSATGIAEYIRPSRLRNRWLRYLIDLRIGRNGKCGMLP